MWVMASQTVALVASIYAAANDQDKQDILVALGALAPAATQEPGASRIPVDIDQLAPWLDSLASEHGPIAAVRCVRLLNDPAGSTAAREWADEQTLRVVESAGVPRARLVGLFGYREDNISALGPACRRAKTARAAQDAAPAGGARAA